VEATNNPDIIHRLLFLAKHMQEELGYNLHVIRNYKLDFQTSDCASMYLDTFSIVDMPKLSLYRKIYSVIRAMSVLLKHFDKRRLLNYNFNGIHLGPIIYDTYLGNYTQSTVNTLDPRLIMTIARVFSRTHLIEKFFAENEVGALLLSHRVGLECGIFQSLANIKEIEVYSFSGDQSLAMSRTLDGTYYPAEPTIEDIETLELIQPEYIAKEFENAKFAHLSYSLTRDTELAFGGRIYQSLKSFFDAKKRNPEGRKVIFIMAHVPNDYPNSFWINPDFCDYHEWLIHCLEQASKNTSIFWIIKEHPSSRAYGFEPGYFEGLEAKFSFEHILFLRCEEDFSVRSFQTIADAIITCNGSAGFEFPALYNIPSVYYHNSYYAKFEFGISVHSITELDNILRNAHAIDLEAQMNFTKARMAYTFIYSLSKVPLALSPPISQSTSLKLGNINTVKKLLDFVNEQSSDLNVQTSEIVKRFGIKGFYAIRNWQILVEK
jgi:hypothetical protein